MTPPVALALLAVVAVIAAVVLWIAFRRPDRPRPVPRGAADAFHLLLEGRRGEAREVMARLIRTGEAPPEVYLHLGDLLRQEGDAARALSLHQGLLARPRLDPDLRKLVEVSIADDLLAQQRFEETRHRLEELERRVRDPELLRRLAAALHHLGRREDAAQRLRERADLAGPREKGEAAAYMAELGREALREGRPQTARDLCRRALRLDPGLGAAYEVDGDRELAQGRPDRAVDVWKEGLRHSREGARGFLPRLAEAAFRAGKVETLLADLERERAARPRDVALWRAVADLRLRRGDLESFFALVESPPAPGAADLTAWAGWIRHLSRLHDQAPLLRLLRSLPDSFGPAAWTCAHCGAPDVEARQACLHCGALEPLRPVDVAPAPLALPAEVGP